jgi:hypothetical protein
MILVDGKDISVVRSVNCRRLETSSTTCISFKVQSSMLIDIDVCNFNT